MPETNERTRIEAAAKKRAFEFSATISVAFAAAIGSIALALLSSRLTRARVDFEPPSVQIQRVSTVEDSFRSLRQEVDDLQKQLHDISTQLSRSSSQAVLTSRVNRVEKTVTDMQKQNAALSDLLGTDDPAKKMSIHHAFPRRDRFEG